MGVRIVRKKGLLSVKIPGLSKAVAEKPVTRSKVSIDYPQEGERVHCGHYAIRITAGDGECQASINDGEWQSCRTDAGYSWFDWFPEKPGSQHITVRARVNGKWVKAERVCDVE
jgi:hypothetical protein